MFPEKHDGDSRAVKVEIGSRLPAFVRGEVLHASQKQLPPQPKVIALNPSRKLLFITERYAPDLGGVARSSTRTARALAALGCEVHVLAWTRTQQAGELTSGVDGEGAQSVQLHRLGLFSNWDLSLQHTTNVLEWLHEQTGFDGVWGHYVYPAGFLGVMFAETNSIPSVVSARGNDIDRLMFPPGDFARLSWTLDRATGIAAVSHDLARKIDVLLGKADRAQVVHNSVDLETFRPQPADPELRAALGLDPDDLVLGFCGEMRHKKGLPFLLRCLDEVCRERPAKLLVIGAVRPREQSHLTEFFVEHADLEDKIIATGVLEEPADVARHTALCDVMLLPSVWEGLPNALLESMACGVIPIASDAGGIPEVIDHQVNGFVLPKSQLNQLSRAVLEIGSQDESTLEPIRQRARTKMEEQFTHDVELKRLASILDGVFAED